MIAVLQFAHLTSVSLYAEVTAPSLEVTGVCVCLKMKMQTFIHIHIYAYVTHLHIKGREGD